MARIKPFLKWAGNKFRILDKILPELPKGQRLVEPFAGSAAVYLNAPFECALVCDINPDLITLYATLQSEGEEFIRYCASFFTSKNNTKEGFYSLRAAFNESPDPVLRAALFLYLNRHAFNGLIRYNSRGGFNVPFGRYAKPYFPLNEMREFHRKSITIETEFRVMDFRKVFANIRKNDVVYCDPPYVPLSDTANFAAYSGQGFGEADQAELAALARTAWNRGVPVILSNHDTAGTRRLYSAATILRFDVQRFISCNGNNRRSAPELLARYGHPKPLTVPV